MSDLYKAPEVLLGLPWEYPVDVFSIGVMVSTSTPKLCDTMSNSGPKPIRHLSSRKGRTYSTPLTESTISMFFRWHWPSISDIWVLHHWR